MCLLKMLQPWQDSLVTPMTVDDTWTSIRGYISQMGLSGHDDASVSMKEMPKHFGYISKGGSFAGGQMQNPDSRFTSGRACWWSPHNQPFFTHPETWEGLTEPLVAF